MSFCCTPSGAPVASSHERYVGRNVCHPTCPKLPAESHRSSCSPIRYSGTTDGDGIYAVHNLPPGPYSIQVSKFGFKTLIKPDVTLNIQDALAINFTFPIGAFSGLGVDSNIRVGMIQRTSFVA